MKERDIRPKHVHESILSLAEKDTQTFLLPRKEALIDVACPACAADKKTHAFIKFGLSYVTCDACKTLYLSPRPSEALLSEVYNKMESVQYWETAFYKETAEARREKIHAPRAQKIQDIAKAHGKNGNGETLLDIGCGYGIFLEEIKKLNFFDTLVGIEPTASLAAVTRKKGIPVREVWVGPDTAADIPERADVLTCFEVMEHVFDPAAFIGTMAQLVKPGGIMIFTFPSGSGFDVQLLWEKSNTVYPPHHINLMTVEGVERLIARVSSVALIEIATPGVLDVDIVRNAYRDGAMQNTGHFFDYFFSRNDDAACADLQSWLQKHRLSSHLWLVLRKK